MKHHSQFFYNFQFLSYLETFFKFLKIIWIIILQLFVFRILKIFQNFGFILNFEKIVEILAKFVYSYVKNEPTLTFWYIKWFHLDFAENTDQ